MPAVVQCLMDSYGLSEFSKRLWQSFTCLCSFVIFVVFAWCRRMATLHNGTLQPDRCWHFIVYNGPYSLYNAYQQLMDGMVDR